MPVELAHQMAGTGAPVIILHGLFGSSSNWRGIARKLQANYRTCLVDLRNHGRSAHAEPMDYPELAADVLSLLDRLGLDEVHLLGHSMGGKTAMRIALSYPHRVTSLVVADIAPAPSDSDHVPLLDALRGLNLEGLNSRADADAALEPAIPTAPLRAFLLQNLTSSANGFAWRIPLEFIQAAMPDLHAFPCSPKTESYTGPSLFVKGGNSDYIRPEHEELIQRLFPQASITSIDQAGHWLHAEQPDEFVRVVTTFLAGLSIT